jgi:hypothetical protein
MSWNWPEFLKVGDNLYKYMILNYNTMINVNKIRDFEIIDNLNKFSIQVNELNKQCKHDIEKELIPWIQNEYTSGRLFNKTNWKPFRDLDVLTLCVLGYKIIFQYKHYYLQLIIDSYYWADEEITNTNYAYFQLTLYGWINDLNDKLQPENLARVPPDNIMPDAYWELQ